VTHKIIIERNTLRFAAAHFTTFGGECEPLHGHNYDVIVEISGALTSDSWVIDFSDAKALVRGLCKELDHKFIVPGQSKDISISHSNGEVELKWGERRYVIPEADTVSVDVDNTTAERLAEWFAGRIAAELRKLSADNVTSVTVGVEEMPGQSGWFTLALP
jgi:6-pyruvoyltetrahydropterin/6-carboxytetrahydropterin synthase